MPNQPDNPYTSMTDGQLANAAQADDLDAFEELVRRHQDSLLCFLKFYSRGSNDIEDVAQEAFLKCFVHMRQFDVQRSFRTWLYTIARRSIPRDRKNSSEPLLHPELTQDSMLEPGSQASIVESRQSIWKTLRMHTSDDEFQLIWLRYAECLTISEIATVFRSSKAACKMRLSRIRKRLKPRLAKYLEHSFREPARLLTQTRAA